MAEGKAVIEEKVRRLRHLLETPLTRPFSEVHEEIEKTMERPVWTHEMAFPELLYEELRNDRKGEAFGKSIRELAKKKPVIVVGFGKKRGEE